MFLSRKILTTFGVVGLLVALAMILAWTLDALDSVNCFSLAAGISMLASKMFPL